MWHLQARILTQLGIERLGFGHLFAAGLAAYRLIAHGFAILYYGHHIGIHPVVIAILAAILYQGAPGIPRLDGLPHVSIGGGRHVWVTYHIVGAADQLLFGETADLQKVAIDEGDIALQIRHRDDADIVTKGDLFLGDWLVVSMKSDGWTIGNN